MEGGFELVCGVGHGWFLACGYLVEEVEGVGVVVTHVMLVIGGGGRGGLFI